MRATRQKIVKKIFLGDTQVVSIQTSSKTLIVDGYMSHNCHVHWHELNDLVYIESDYNNLPHDPFEATDVEIMAELVKWKSGQMGRLFELASSQNAKKFRDKMENHEKANDE